MSKGFFFGNRKNKETGGLGAEVHFRIAPEGSAGRRLPESPKEIPQNCRDEQMRRYAEAVGIKHQRSPKEVHSGCGRRNPDIGTVQGGNRNWGHCLDIRHGEDGVESRLIGILSLFRRRDDRAIVQVARVPRIKFPVYPRRYRARTRTKLQPKRTNNEISRMPPPFPTAFFRSLTTDCFRCRGIFFFVETLFTGVTWAVNRQCG